MCRLCCLFNTPMNRRMLAQASISIHCLGIMVLVSTAFAADGPIDRAPSFGPDVTFHFQNEEQVISDSTWYSTDAFTDYAIQFAREAQTDNKLFFMYLAYKKERIARLESNKKEISSRISHIMGDNLPGI